MNTPVTITSSDIAVTAEGKALTKISSQSLVNALTQKPDEAIDLLSSSFASIKLEDITIAPDGRVVVDNPAFHRAAVAKLAERLQASELPEMGGKPPKNLGCGVKC